MKRMIKLKLKELREKKNIRQYELASVIRCASSKISKIECGKQELLFKEAIIIAKYLDIPINALFEIIKKE